MKNNDNLDVFSRRVMLFCKILIVSVVSPLLVGVGCINGYMLSHILFKNLLGAIYVAILTFILFKLLLNIMVHFFDTHNNPKIYWRLSLVTYGFISIISFSLNLPDGGLEELRRQSHLPSKYPLAPQNDEDWRYWRSSDGNAKIVNCDNYTDEGSVKELLDWRPATEEELYKYKDEFPRTVPRFVYAGASLIYGEDYKTGEPVAYVTGCAPCGYDFFSSLKELSKIEAIDLQLVIRKDFPVQGRLEYYLGKPETIGIYEIPRLTKKEK